MKKDKWSTILLIFILIAGLSLLLYPSFSDYWNSRTQSQVVASYVDSVAHMDDDKYAEIWNEAKEYNRALLDRDNSFLLSPEARQQYNRILDIAGNGIMAYVDIPAIDVFLPIYHGTDETILQVAIGHLDWTSLPVGGESTHCVISGHRGLPSARLFTDLDELAVGDVFMLNVLDETLTYEIDQIKIVLPHETTDLLIVPGEDHCTLVTCTPYGVNSHRMLVRGKRIDNIKEAVTVRVTADAVLVEKLVVAPFILAPILLVMLFWLMITTRKKH